jgi:hypothetical protein
VIDLKHEVKRELGLIDPPDLWDRIQADSSTGDVLDFATAPQRRRPSLWLAVAAAAVLIMLVVAVTRSDDGHMVDTSPADGPPVPETLLIQRHLEFDEAPVDQGIGVPPGGGLTVPAGGGLAGSTLDISVEGDDGVLTGNSEIHGFADFPGNPGIDLTIEFGCFETDTTDVILGGTVRTSSGHSPRVGEWIALLIREGSSATVWWDPTLSSCRELLDSVPHPRPDDRFVDVIEPSDSEPG